MLMNRMSTLKPIILSCLLLLGVALADAQTTISGVVTDEGQSPIEFANVVAYGSGKFLSGATTKADGVFSMGVVDTTSLVLVCSHVGMMADTIVYKGQPLRITLRGDKRMLEGVTVTANRDIFQTKGDVITADVENSALSKSGQFDNLINQLPFVSGAGGDYEVFGRGKAIVYINNRKLRDNEELRSLTADKIKKVEVVTNPGARYSTEIGAVIRVYTKDNPDGLGGNLTAYLQQGRKLSNYDGASLTYNHGKVQVYGIVSISLTGRELRMDDALRIASTPTSLLTDSVIDNYNSTYASANVGVDYVISNTSNVGINVRGSLGKFNNNLSMTAMNHYTDGVLDFNTNAMNYTTLRPSQLIASAYYTASLGKTRLELTNDLMVGRKHDTFGYDEETDATVNTDGAQNYIMNSLIADFTTPMGKNVSLNYGAELTYSHDKQSFGFSEQDISTGLANSTNKTEQWLNAEYLSLRYNLGKAWTLNGGMRYEYTHLNYYENGMKSSDQSRGYSNFFPNLNVSFSPMSQLSLSVGYRMSIIRPSYGMLNDNTEYMNRFAYHQGNSMLRPQITNDINLLASYKNLKLIASYDIIRHGIMSVRSVYGQSADIALTKPINAPGFGRLNLGVNWWQKFGVYTPYLELDFTKQYFDYEYMGAMKNFGTPTWNVKVHNTFTLPKDFMVMLFVDYYGNRYDMLRRSEYRWTNMLSVSKSFKNGIFVQLSANGFLCPRRQNTTTYCGWITDGTTVSNDNRSVALQVSWNFNAKRARHNANVKTSEMMRF